MPIKIAYILSCAQVHCKYMYWYAPKLWVQQWRYLEIIIQKIFQGSSYISKHVIVLSKVISQKVCFYMCE